MMWHRLGWWFVACAGGLLVVRRSGAASRWRSAWWGVADREWSRRRLLKSLDGFPALHLLVARGEIFRRNFSLAGRFLPGRGGSCAAREFRRTRRAGRIAAWLPEPRWLACPHGARETADWHGCAPRFPFCP